MSVDDPIIRRTVAIAAAYVTRNSVSPSDLPNLLLQVHSAVTAAVTEIPVKETLQPAVPIRKSVRPEAIVCLEDGRHHRSLKQHLRTAHGMTPEQYRDKWGLPKGYPMVAPDFSAARSTTAKRIGLGRRPDSRGNSIPD
ncbi:MAG: MucR family transcriptional regulator [Gammaproteobacteria bacterium]